MEALIVFSCMALGSFAVMCVSITFLIFQKWDRNVDKELEREREFKKLQEENLALYRSRKK